VERLDEAIARLERAVARLDAACTGFSGGGEAARRVAEAQAESRRLRAAVGEIAGRVDGALARIDRALGEGG
jgi:exonuclease VII small subunit